MISICFLIRQLNEGGAQRQLLTLLKGMDKAKYDISVLSFYEGGYFSEEIKEIPNIKYISLKKRGRWDVFVFLYHLNRQLRQICPDILHAYMDAPNCLSIFLKPFMPKTRMVWGVRASNMDLSRYNWLPRTVYRFECFLSRFADLIIVNSKAGCEHAALQGFPANKMVVIPNGIDTEKFKPGPIRARMRSEWGKKDGDILIGLIGRLDPMKDHPTFLKAASLIAKNKENVRFVCVGNGPESYKNKLIALGNKLGLTNRLLWLDFRDDISKVYNALDLVCSSSSFGEGFPNVIGEAMASGVPCVVTDVGDSPWIVGDTGVVVPPDNPKALAEGLLKCLNKENEETSIQARLRIEKNFSLKNLVERTESVLCPNILQKNSLLIKKPEFFQ
jgi:glycosyltransferase involved in cell wall biosynthesis